MGERWLPYAAAALATGASALMMGALALPSPPSGTELLSALDYSPDRWLLASVAFMYAAVALTLGIPTFFHLLKQRGRHTGYVGATVFAFGTVGTAGYAALLILMRALALNSVLGDREVDLLTRDVGLIVYVGAFLVAFQVGLVMLGVALVMAGTVRLWIPVLMIVPALSSPFVHLLPEGLQAAHSLMIGVALIGVAVSANESWAGLTKRAPL